MVLSNICKDLLTLSQMKVGTSSTIACVSNNQSYAVDLAEMGFLPGVPLVLVRRSPLGELFYIKFRGACIAIRKEVADCIFLN